MLILIKEAAVTGSLFCVIQVGNTHESRGQYAPGSYKKKLISESDGNNLKGPSSLSDN